MYDVIVVGGGASGMMAAGTAAALSKNTLLIEKMPRTGRKILVTGKGRCNVTNDCDIETVMKNTISNPKFLYSSLMNFNSRDTMRLFESLGVELKVERGNRVFPVSDRAMDIADALRKYCTKNSVKVITDTVAEIIVEDGCAKGVKTVSNQSFFAPSVIIATGGLSYPKTGSSGDGYKMAQKIGHTVTALRPSLVGLKIKGSDFKNLQGLSLKNTRLTLKNIKTGKAVFTDMGEMLFTHFGISGPLVLSASAYIKENEQDYMVELDLKPALSIETLDSRICRDFEKFINKDAINALDELLPKSLIPIMLKRSLISPHQKVNQITKNQREALMSSIKALKFEVIGKEDIETAIITAGGVSTKEIDPKTMQSKLVKGVYFTGEIIDVDACTGGFNLQIAFSTGYCAGTNA